MYFALYHMDCNLFLKKKKRSCIFSSQADSKFSQIVKGDTNLNCLMQLFCSIEKCSANSSNHSTF